MQPPLTPDAMPFFTAAEAVKAVSVAAALIFMVWAVYTLVTAYHWLRYAHRSAVAVPALITHVVVSGLLAVYAISGFTG
jgi:hypothetical protein